jgi:hypothetical protein
VAPVSKSTFNFVPDDNKRWMGACVVSFEDSDKTGLWLSHPTCHQKSIHGAIVRRTYGNRLNFVIWHIIFISAFTNKLVFNFEIKNLLHY